MFLIYGKRVAKIKEFTDNSNNCTSCKAFDLQIRVYREYYHVFYIPFLPFGDKVADIRCNECTEPIRTEALKKVYEKYTRTPVYMYTVLLLLVCMIGLGVYFSIQGQRDRVSYIAKPRVGDVYLINKDENKATTYYFLRLVEINDDTVLAYHNNYMYLDYVNQFNPDDYFVKDEKWYFTKAEILQMFEKDEITMVEREYGASSGFYRIK